MKLKLIVRPSDPLVLDRMTDVAYAFNWAIYAAWGLVASILGIGTITNSVGEVYNFLWSGAIGTLSTIACLAAISLFFDFGRFAPPIKKQVELWAVRCLIPMIAVYPALLIIAAFSGDTVRGPTAIHAISFLIFPVLRTYNLKRRIERYYRAQKESIPNGTD